MATYYVRPDGNDGNAGTGSSTAQAWATIVKALGATGITGGDTVYIAPGRYAAQIVIGGTYSSSTFVTGDPLCTQFSGLTAGKVFITNIASNGANLGIGVLVNGSGKSNLAFSGIAFEHTSNSIGARCVDLLLGQNNSFTKCTFRQTGYGAPLINMTSPASLALNATLDRCVMGGGQVNYSGSGMIQLYGNNVSDATTVKNCLIHTGASGAFLYCSSVSVSFFNCTFINHPSIAIQSVSGSLTYPTYVRNCLFVGINISIHSSVTGHIVQEYNRLMNSSMYQVATSVTSSSSYDAGIEDGYSLINGLNTTAIYATQLGGVNTSFGTAIGAPTTDIYGFPWSGTSPDAGASTYKTLATINPVYNPTERNASTITIAPASTSQSIELYLGATGLAFNTSGLAAYYVRNQSAPVAITLVTQTATGAWSSGGFAEISSSFVPGVYRLDVPDAAFAAGASDVTIVVRGASGTNGAVLTVTLSSGGLTAAQTASAVWDEPYTSHVTASTFGARTLKTVADNRLVNVGTANHIESNLHAVVNSTAAASELSGALLHNGTDYIDSNLLGGASTRVFVGRFDLRQTGSETVDTIEVFTTDTPSFELQLTDGDGNSVPVTGATLGLRILDVASTVVETGTPTVEYGTGGIVRWTGPGTYLAIGCPVGNYRLFIDRTVSGTTTTFGPLQIRVQAQ
jgi:hypothetical protein